MIKIKLYKYSEHILAYLTHFAMGTVVICANFTFNLFVRIELHQVFVYFLYLFLLHFLLFHLLFFAHDFYLQDCIQVTFKGRIREVYKNFAFVGAYRLVEAI